MTVKKIAIVTAVSVAALGMSSSFAGGHYTAPVADHSGVYVEVNAAAAMRNVEENSSLTATAATASAGNFKNGKSGFSFGAGLGYAFSKTWGVEVGYQWLPKTDLDATGSYSTALNAASLSAADKVNVKSWMMHMALKASLPVSDSVSAFSKFGVACTHNDVKLTGTSASSSAYTHSRDTSYMNTFFGVGLAYHIDSNWSVSLEYDHAAGGKKVSSAAGKVMLASSTGTEAGTHVFPAYNVFKLNVGYFFNV